MKLFTSLPARKDGTLKVTVKSGNKYVFDGKPLSCDVDDEDDVEYLQLLGFMTEDEYDAESKFKEMEAAREKRRAAAGLRTQAAGGKKSDEGDDDGDDDLDTGNGAPVESGTAPTGRVRKAAPKASVVS